MNLAPESLSLEDLQPRSKYDDDNDYMTKDKIDDLLAPSPLPPAYRRNRVGSKVPGWSDLNCSKLARNIGVGDGHLRMVLTGKCNTSTALLGTIAEHLGMTMEELVRRIGVAQQALVGLAPIKKHTSISALVREQMRKMLA